MASSVAWYTRNDFPVFRLRENLENLLVEGCPIPPARAAYVALQTLHLWSGDAPWRALNTGHFPSWEKDTSCFWKRPQDAQPPRQGREKRPPVAALFRSLGSRTQQVFCISVYAYVLLADCFRWNWNSGAGCAERWKTVFGGSG